MLLKNTKQPTLLLRPLRCWLLSRTKPVMAQAVRYQLHASQLEGPGDLDLPLQKTSFGVCYKLVLVYPTLHTYWGTSVRTIRRRMEEFGLSVSDFYSSISDNDLDGIVIEVLAHFPNSGYRMMAGHLHEKTWDSCTATANSRKSPPCCSCLYSCQMECNSSMMHLQCYISACSLACWWQS